LSRVAVLLLALAAALPAAETRPEYVQAVEFPYYLYPHTLWERELVWLKNIGIDTIEFSIPWNFHQAPDGETDLNGSTSPRRDLAGFVRLLRRLGLRGWVRPMPPVSGLIAGGGHPDAAQQRAWLKKLDQLLAPQTISHGGPIGFVEGHWLTIDAAAPPSPVVAIAATDPQALSRSRETIAAGRGSLLWTDVEDAIYPAGWALNPTNLLHHGAVGLNGDERPATAALRRDAALLRGWDRLLSQMRTVPIPKPPAGKLPAGVTVSETISSAAGAVSITNNSASPFLDELRVTDPVTRKTLVVPSVSVPPGQSLWLPLQVSIGPGGLCRECTNFSSSERVVYATAELNSIEYENGILAMEFAAPQAGEVILQLARRPVGPFLAAGKPTDFEWDDHEMRARLPIPASTQPGNRVRIGIAIEAPDTSAFFNELRRLVIGFTNTVSTIYSSAAVALRSRLRLPEGYTAKATTKSPNEIEYEIGVPAEALHGDFVNLAIEADGVALGRARVQLFRPASIRLVQAIPLHFGATEMTPDPPVAAIDPRAGGILEIAIRNNSAQIQTYHIEPAGEGLEFFPPKTDVSVAPTDERRVELRVFAAEGIGGLRDWTLKLKGGADVTTPMRLVLVPRGRTVAWSADLDGDGAPEWIVESPRVRAIFSPQDGGRWMELTWKDTGTNFLPETGVFAQAGPVEVRPVENGIEFTGKDWKRTVSLSDTALTIEQSVPLPEEMPKTEKRGNTTLTLERPSPTRAIYTLR
jgi:Glycosyl hydrolases family 35